jgi:hypothetical protein
MRKPFVCVSGFVLLFASCLRADPTGSLPAFQENSPHFPYYVGADRYTLQQRVLYYFEGAPSGYVPITNKVTSVAGEYLLREQGDAYFVVKASLTPITSREGGEDADTFEGISSSGLFITKNARELAQVSPSLRGKETSGVLSQGIERVIGPFFRMQGKPNFYSYSEYPVERPEYAAVTDSLALSRSGEVYVWNEKQHCLERSILEQVVAISGPLALKWEGKADGPRKTKLFALKAPNKRSYFIADNVEEIADTLFRKKDGSVWQVIPDLIETEGEGSLAKKIRPIATRVTSLSAWVQEGAGIDCAGLVSGRQHPEAVKIADFLNFRVVGSPVRRHSGF